MLMYADDVKIYRVANNDEDKELIQSDIDSMCEQALANKMILNKDKCEVMHFTYKRSWDKSKYIAGGTYIKENSFIKELGVLIDNNCQRGEISQ